MNKDYDKNTSPTIAAHGRHYFCRRCKGLYDEEQVPIGEIIKMPDGYNTYICSKCKTKEKASFH